MHKRCAIKLEQPFEVKLKLFIQQIYYRVSTMHRQSFVRYFTKEIRLIFFFLFNKNSWTEHRWIREKIFFFTIEKDRWSNSKNLFYFSYFKKKILLSLTVRVRFLFFFFRWFDLVWKQFIANLLHFWLNVNINTCYIFPSEELLSQEIIFMIINNFYACMQIEKLHVLFLIR